MVQIRRLTQRGRDDFKAWLEQGAVGAAPFYLLTDPDTSADVDGVAHVEQRSFASRLELGEYLAERLARLPQVSIRFDEGLWDWLSLFYIDGLLPPDSAGSRQVRELVRYALELSNRKWSRHIARMSWMTVKDHGVAARVMLAVPISKHTDVMEQIGGQQEAFGARSVVELADRLYFDADAGRLKRGAQSKSAGSPRRLRTFLGQFRRTYDPPRMTVDQLAECLPGEFDRWKRRERTAPSTAASKSLAALRRVIGLPSST
jgi:hypothetical protein